jgi:hypothetical protein
MTLLVRDEEDLVAANLDYHLSQGVDRFIVTDHLSEDATAEILKDYVDRGLVHYIHESSEGYDQHVWVTRMARMAFTEHGADWVINSDADEFWWPKEGTLASTFACLPASVNVVKAPRFNFVPVDGTGAKHYDRMLYRERISYNLFGKPLPPKVAHRGSPNVTVLQGNHAISGIGKQRIARNSVEILHFPVRTYAQIENKIAKGGRAYTRTTGLPENAGRTWRALYRDYERDGNIRSYFGECLYDSERLARALAAGELVVDRRLSDHFAKLYSSSGSSRAGFGARPSSAPWCR